MKKVMLLFTILLGVMFLSSSVVSMSEAKMVAENCFLERTGANESVVTIEPIGNREEPSYYFCYLPNGFVIVAGETRVRPILGFSEGNHSGKEIPPQLQRLLQQFKEEIEYARNQSIEQDYQINQMWEYYLTENFVPTFIPRNDHSLTPTLQAQHETISLQREVSALLTTTWDQNDLYNSACPEDASGPDGHVYAGCVATAMGQVMKYHNYPSSGVGSYSYTQSPYGTISADFANTTYHWVQMPGFLTTGSSPQEIESVATLLYHCGVAVEMYYGAGGSGAWIGHDTDRNAADALVDHFDYKSSLQFVEKADYTDAVWHALLQANLDDGLPIIYAGWGEPDEGHAWVCDGYNSSNEYHMNWGWSGYYNGYYALTSLQPHSTMPNFVNWQQAVVGIEPKQEGAVLWSQMDSSGNGGSSQDFEAAYDAYDNQGADDFVVTDGPWNVDVVKLLGFYSAGGGPAEGFNIFFYNDAAGMPGSEITSFSNLPYTETGGEFTIYLPSSQSFANGHYWISIQARMDYDPNGQFYWTQQVAPIIENPAHWRNPLDGFGQGAIDWTLRTDDYCFQLETLSSDPVFAINPTEWDFGQVPLDSATSRQFTITNTGGGSLTINSITFPFGTLPYFTFTEHNAPVTLTAGQTTTFTVQYLPTVVGAHNAAVQINDSRANTTVPLTGEGVDITIDTFPWLEDFNDTTFPPAGWMVVDSDGVVPHWTRSETQSHSAPSSALHDFHSSINQDGWLITPQIEIPPDRAFYELKFWSYNEWPGYYGKNSVLVSTTGTALVDFTEIWSPATVTEPWVETTLPLSAYANQTIYIAFRYEGTDAHSWFLDDVSIDEEPAVLWDLTMLAPVGSGSVIPDVGVHTYGEGTIVNLTAQPALGFFDEWQVDGAFYSADRLATIEMFDNYEAQAFFSLPAGSLAENFNAGNPVPNAWIETAIDRQWQQGAPLFFDMFDNFTTIGQFAGDAEEMLITPAVVIDGSVTEFAYWLVGGNNLGAHGGSTVQLKYQEVGAKAWTDIGAPINMIDNNNLQYIVQDISAIPNGTYNFAFAVVSTFATDGFLSWVGIDNVVGPALSGAEMDDLEVVSVSFPNEIMYAGDIAVLSAEIKNVGLNSQTGTQVTFTIDDGRTVLTTNIGTLNYNETEVVTVNYTTVAGRHTITASIPADDNNANNEAFTQCVVAVAGNLAEGFEGTVEGWFADAEWWLAGLAWLPPYEGETAIYNGDMANYTDSYLITPKVILTGAEELNFYASFGNQGVGAADLAVDYSADGVTWTNMMAPFVPTATMQLYTADLSAIPAGEYFLAFVASGSTDGTYATVIGVDHVIGPELAPQTIDVPANFAIAMVGGVLQLAWDAVAGANSYIIYGSANPYGVFAPVDATDQLTYNLSGSEDYHFYYVTASTDVLPVMTAKKTIFVSPKAANRSVSLIPQGSAREYVAPEARTIPTSYLRVPRR